MCREAFGSVDSTAERRTSHRPTRASGALTQNVERQPRRPVRTPPTAGPAAWPTQATAIQAPNALGCSSGGNIGGISASVAGRISAAPTPIAARPTIIPSTPGANAAASETAPITSRPTSSIRLRPNTSPRRPAASTSAPVDRLKALLAHCSWGSETDSSSAIVGTATPKSANDSHTMPAATHMPVSAFQRWSE